MSTRAVVTIKDDEHTFHIYTHCDGYPAYQVERIKRALPYAWELPRFEAMDFAAAFIAGSAADKKGKHSQGGNIYFTTGWEDHGDIDHAYEITAKAGALHVEHWECRIQREGPVKRASVFSGPFKAFYRDHAKTGEWA